MAHRGYIEDETTPVSFNWERATPTVACAARKLRQPSRRVMRQPDAASAILKATAMILADVEKDLNEGLDAGGNEGLAERVTALLDSYADMAVCDFPCLIDGKEWLARVAEILPRLWD